jgi:hypothetical protein
MILTAVKAVADAADDIQRVRAGRDVQEQAREHE